VKIRNNSKFRVSELMGVMSVESFGTRLNKLRKNKNLSQEEFAEIMNVSRQSISKWENDSAYPEMTKLIFMSNFFEVKLDFLILGEEPVNEVVKINPSIGKAESLSMAVNTFFSNLHTKQKVVLLLFCVTALLVCLAIIYGSGYVIGQLLYYINH